MPTGRATLIVTVLDRRSDKPVEGVRLEATRWEAHDTLAGEESPRSLARLGALMRQETSGTIVLSGVPAPGRVWLRLAAKGYESVDVGPVELLAPGALVRQVYFLSPRASVVGRVVEKRTRRALPGTRVWIVAADELSGEKINTTTTGADGRFEILDVPAGRRCALFRAPGGAPEVSVDVSVLPGQRHDLGDIEISDQGATLRGRVWRARADQPVSSATVELIAQPPADRPLERTRTNERGEFVFSRLANGAYVLNLPDEHYSRPLLLAPEEERSVIVALGGVTLRGRLLCEGKPTAGSIALSRGPHGMSPARVAFASDDGRFELSGLEPGRWRLLLGGARAAIADETIDIPDQPTVERDFTLPTGRIVGRVLEDTGLPVANARVECSYQPEHPYAAFLRPRTVSARTDREGHFELGPLPEGTFCVRAEHPTEGYGVSPPISVPRSGVTPRVDITLRRARGAALRSVALNFETGAPIREAFLVLYDAAGRVARSAPRNDAGIAEVTGLAPGTYQMEVSASGYTADVRTIDLREGEVRTIESVLATAGAVRLWAESPEGLALDGVKLRLDPLDPSSLEEPREGTTEFGGLWVARGVAPGDYRLTARFPDGVSAVRSVRVRARDVTELVVRPSP